MVTPLVNPLLFQQFYSRFLPLVALAALALKDVSRSPFLRFLGCGARNLMNYHKTLNISMVSIFSCFGFMCLVSLKALLLLQVMEQV